jgi:hypothetical protein
MRQRQRERIPRIQRTQKPKMELEELSLVMLGRVWFLPWGLVLHKGRWVGCDVRKVML